MPHIAVTMVSGRSDEVKKNLADKIHKLVAEELGIADSRISVSIHDVEGEEWRDFMTQFHEDHMYVLPGYQL